MSRLATLLLSTLILASFAATAEPAPILLREQGHLLDRHGMIVTGRVTLTFALYFTPSGGRPLWQERHTLTPTNGAFSILLGEARPFPPAVFDGGPLYLGVRLNADAEVTPREELAGVSPALIAGTASRASPDLEGITPVSLHSVWSQASAASAEEAAPETHVVPEVSSFTPAPPQRPQAPRKTAETAPAARPMAGTRSSPAPTSVIASRLQPGDPHCPDGGTRLVTGADETYVCDGAFALVIGSSEPAPIRPPAVSADMPSVDARPLRPPAPAAEPLPTADSPEQRPPPETWITCGENSCEAHGASTRQGE